VRGLAYGRDGSPVVRLFTDDGVGCKTRSVMRRALTYAKPLGVRLASTARTNGWPLAER